MKKILLLAAHPDDVEFGMGATVSKLIRQKHEVKIIVFTDCGISVELHLSLKRLQINSNNISLYYNKVRILPVYRQFVLEHMIHTKSYYQPDIVYLPCSFDMHQDHQVVHNEGVRAFKHSTIYGYSFDWNNISENLRHFEVVTKADLEKKEQALKCYQSQKDRYYYNMEMIWNQARLSGRIIHQEYAERFELIRQINK